MNAEPFTILGILAAFILVCALAEFLVFGGGGD